MGQAEFGPKRVHQKRSGVGRQLQHDKYWALSSCTAKRANVLPWAWGDMPIGIVSLPTPGSAPTARAEERHERGLILRRRRAAGIEASKLLGRVAADEGHDGMHLPGSRDVCPRKASRLPCVSAWRTWIGRLASLFSSSRASSMPSDLNARLAVGAAQIGDQADFDRRRRRRTAATKAAPSRINTTHHFAMIDS